MSGVNPPGTVFVELIANLMDLVATPDVSRIEVVMAGYEFDEHGQHKMVEGVDVVTKRFFSIERMDKPVQEELRKELDAPPIAALMVLWISRTRQAVGMLRFAIASGKSTRGIEGMNHIEKSIMADYLNRQ